MTKKTGTKSNITGTHAVKLAGKHKNASETDDFGDNTDGHENKKNEKTLHDHVANDTTSNPLLARYQNSVFQSGFRGTEAVLKFLAFLFSSFFFKKKSSE